MAVGYAGCAVAIFWRRLEADALIALYSLGLVLAYAATRETLPVEPIGLATKAAEAGLALIAGALFVRAAR
jgi:hypothetical protein